MSLKMQAGSYLISALCYTRGINFINSVALSKKQSRPTRIINRTDSCKWCRIRIIQNFIYKEYQHRCNTQDVKYYVPSKYCILQEVKYTSRQECCSMQKVKYAIMINSAVFKK
jgi:hypothetical protein